MTVSHILTFVNEVRPNAYSDDVKIQFLNEVESELFDFLMKFEPRPYDEITNIEAIKMEQAIKEEAPETPVAEPEETVSEEEPENPEETPVYGTTTIVDPLNMGARRQAPKPIYTLKPYAVTDKGATVLLPERYMGVYTSYIMAKLDYLASETVDYQNDASMHQAEMAAFQEYYTRTHMPKHPRIGGLS